jgi:hypothetical protein
MTLISTRQDPEEQEEAFKVQPYSAWGLVDAGPQRFPTRKEEDLV